MTRVAVTGATGAMGDAVLNIATERADVEVDMAITRQDPTAVPYDVTVVSPHDLEAERIDAVDVIVDFTVPEGSLRVMEAARQAGVGVVTGTTGFTDEQFDEIEVAAHDIPVLHAANFSRGVQALNAALETVLERVPTYDIEVTETHHNRKRDAPSGTANQLLETIEAARPDAERVHGRSGEQSRSAGDIGVHARRAGTITGEHEILLAGNHEEVRLVHRAESRGVFAAGALDAATWIEGKPSGWYRFADVINT